MNPLHAIIVTTVVMGLLLIGSIFARLHNERPPEVRTALGSARVEIIEKQGHRFAVAINGSGSSISIVELKTP